LPASAKNTDKLCARIVAWGQLRVDVVTDRVLLFRIGVAGLALMRLSPDGSNEDIEAALAKLAAIPLPDSGHVDPLPEVDAATGYRKWSGTYDAPGNPLITLEETAVVALINQLKPGLAIDIAAGTGRHARRLAALGHRVLAVDSSADMLARLRDVAGVTTAIGDITALPVATASCDLAVCSLALTHASVLGPPMREIARVLRPGGEAILSDVHPVIAATGGMAFYRTTAGEQRFVRNHVHWASAYMDAFASAGLNVMACYEPRLGEATGVRHFMSNPSPSEEAIARLPSRDSRARSSGICGNSGDRCMD
jgi:ubiquinone/menaquinone biosynthesis C-methylase UbiE